MKKDNYEEILDDDIEEELDEYDGFSMEDGEDLKDDDLEIDIDIEDENILKKGLSNYLDDEYDMEEESEEEDILDEEDEDGYSEEDFEEEDHDDEDEELDEFSRKRFSQRELKEMAAITDLITSNQFIGKVDTKNLLSADQERALFERMHSSYNKKEIETIKRFIVEKNIGLVVHFAKKIKQTTGGRLMRFEDLVQEGVLGLYSGINRFDYTKGFKVSTYCVWYLRQRMQQFTSDNMFPVRITGHRMRELQQINKIREEFSKENHRDPTIDEIQAITGWPTSRMRDLANLMNGYISLNDQVGGESGDGKSTYGDMIESNESIEGDFSMSETLLAIQNSLSRLTPREKQLFQLHFGFENGKIQNEGMKFGEIEKITGIDRVEIRKSLKKARMKVIEELLKRGIDYSGRGGIFGGDDYDDDFSE